MEPLDPDLWFTMLCPEGGDCMRGNCRHAHSFTQLLPPNETYRSHEDVWQGRVDRFYRKYGFAQKDN